MNEEEKKNVLDNVVTLCPSFNKEVKFYNSKPKIVVIKKFFNILFVTCGKQISVRCSFG